ncbi:MAG TPA: CHAD domain-containing protein [Terriglobales bacterium]|nr:CHAD domain-containing protein [Terriglobales bacterium]
MNDQLPVVIDRLGRWLRQASKSPEAHEVHRLRTSVRRIEVLLGRRLQQDEKLERQLRQLRRRAGRVRDLDVQTEQLTQLHLESDQGRRALLALMEEERKQQARKLRKRLDADHRRSLMRRVRAAAKRRAAVSRVESEGLAGLWRRFPALNGANLHDFRKACKQLRYLAEAHGAGVEQAVLAEALHRVQDTIGTWHDFSELQQRARDSKVAGAALQAAIDNAVTSHFAAALHSAERLRKAPMGHAGPVPVNAAARASA